MVPDPIGDATSRTVSEGPSGELVADTGLIVRNGDTTVSIAPVTEAKTGTFVASGAALEYEDEAGFSYMLTGAGTAANAGYVVIHDQSAPTSYQFQISVDGFPAELTLAQDGSIQIADDTGSIANVVLPAWAMDANGVEIPTSYAVDGNVITQTVSHLGAEYPVVADPGLACDALFCTYEYSRDQTRQIANAEAPWV